MRIVCPSCQAAYEVPAAVLDSACVLRCARCAAEFTPHADADAPAALPVVPPVVAPPDERLGSPFGQAADSPAVRSRLRAVVALSWAVSFAVLALAGWGLVAWRLPIVRAWPAASRAYSALGY